jgi:hypothetical protein
VDCSTVDHQDRALLSALIFLHQQLKLSILVQGLDLLTTNLGESCNNGAVKVTVQVRLLPSLFTNDDPGPSLSAEVEEDFQRIPAEDLLLPLSRGAMVHVPPNMSNKSLSHYIRVAGNREMDEANTKAPEVMSSTFPLWPAQYDRTGSHHIAHHRTAHHQHCNVDVRDDVFAMVRPHDWLAEANTPSGRYCW